MAELSPSISQDVIGAAIERSTQPLREYQVQPGINAERRRLVGERILQVTAIVQSSPEQVAADAQKPESPQTVYDPEHAHLIALAIHRNMTRLAIDSARRASGKRELPWHRATHGDDLLGAMLGERLATMAYRQEPLRADLDMVELLRLQAIRDGNRNYTHVKSAKPSRR